MNTKVMELIVIVVALLIIMAAGAAGMWWYNRTFGPQIEIVKPAEQVLIPMTPTAPFGGLVLERRPNAKPRPPPHKLGKGMKEQRRDTITVQPKNEECPPVTVVMSTVEDDKGGRRVVASSPDGRIVGGLDIPITPILMAPPEQRWAAGLSYGTDSTAGIWVDHNTGIKPFGHELVVGGDIEENEDHDLRARIRVGARF